MAELSTLGSPIESALSSSAGTDGFLYADSGNYETVAAIPVGAPATASSTSGAITLDYENLFIIETTMTEEIDAITLSNIADYATVLWTVQTTADGITFPAGVSRITGGSQAVATTANATMVFAITARGSGDYWVFYTMAEAVA